LNQNPEQIARDKIAAELLQFVWVIQNKNQINLNGDMGAKPRIRPVLAFHSSETYQSIAI